MEQGAVPAQGRPVDGAPPLPGEDGLDERMRLVPVDERAAVLVDRLASRTSSDGLDWIAELARYVERYGLGVPEIRRAATDLAWMARVGEQRYPGIWSGVRPAASPVRGRSGSSSRTCTVSGCGSTTGSGRSWRAATSG
ncbi:hypothetical protein [Actinoallomurus iriomotensis]|uniref:Uncharacterized protein n=1 Tax=Actinoallomurus iriomotensis TaxID=478107 RepID=A0A9W6VT14_9ACTN|nr:hypothetical protein [Actinoallomurus iriomotensis]GLY83978.1 hypothetical protein Airi02_019070 [Actinoallomurus iriomotensis]